MLKYKNLFCLVILCLVTLHFTSKVCASCVCKEKGTDYCASCPDQRIVRPQFPPYQSDSESDFPPIGDNCGGCGKQIVEPAPLPKMPCPKHNKQKCSCKLMTNAIDKFPEALPTSYQDNFPNVYNYVPSEQNQASAPADPVSVSLALQAQKATKVPEAWAHGLPRKPVDQLKKAIYSEVPEEKLFTMNSEIITLPKPKIGFSYNKEAADDYVEEIESDIEPVEQSGMPQLSYQQLGYRVETINEPKFRTVYTDAYNNGRYNNDYEMPIVYSYDNGRTYTQGSPPRKCVKCSKNFSGAH